MENLDLSRTLEAGVSTMLTAGGILLLSALIVMTVVIFKRWHGRIMPIVMGVIAYTIFVFIFTNLVMSALILIPSIDVAFENNQVAYAILYSIFSAIGLTIARVLVVQMMRERYERQGDVMLGGIGVSLGDAFLYGMTVLSYNVMAMGITNTGLESLFAGMTDEQMADTYSVIESLFTTPAPVWLVYGINAVLDVVLCITLMMVVYGAVMKKIPSIWIFYTGLFQCFMSMPLQVADSASLSAIMIAFLVKLVLFAGGMSYIYKVLAVQITYNED